MLLSSILFVYLLNSIGAILADIDKQQGDYKKDLNVLNHFMKRKKIDLYKVSYLRHNFEEIFKQFLIVLLFCLGVCVDVRI